MKKFLPHNDNNATSYYQIGGSFYGLGLLYTGTSNQ
jgi:hypothetical protein